MVWVELPVLDVEEVLTALEVVVEVVEDFTERAANAPTTITTIIKTTTAMLTVLLMA